MELPPPGGGDDGRADPRLAAALAAFDGSAARRAELLAALAGARAFAAVRATATSEGLSAAGLRTDSTAQMSLVSLQAPDGRRALPLFPDGVDVEAWQPGARPVPVPVPQACGAALERGDVAVVLLPSGVALSEEEVRALAAGWVPVPGSGLATRRAPVALRAPVSAPAPALVAALAAALGDEDLRAAHLLEGPDGLVLGVVPRAHLEPAQLAALASRVVGRLGPALPTEGLDLAVVDDAVGGVEVPLRRGGWLRRRGR